ncbi:hypothetical protein [Mesorhizobium sp. WSM3873]|uniref:hypothetical protein n=1 Tax=Mesorhizobium sp. WSM3873 TaxID=1854056 RepID=UPI0008023974|nr:hypothetical protein [Mesorhizobium sp. WSM3873]OBQ83550.1 hypothetical protein A9K71_23575 [Mesorhizobium sp. WSM3873]
MSELEAALERFNRKERYWLLREALGRQPLSEEFRKKLAGVFGSNAGVAVPENAWWAIDYHADWLFGALSTLRYGESFPAHPNVPVQVTGTQEDFDLLIAFERTLIIVEAKAGQHWGNRQVKSKLARLTALVDYNSRLPDPLRLYFVLASPRQPSKLDASSCPPVLRTRDGGVHWIQMGYGSSGIKHLAVSRCDQDGKPDSTADRWRVREVYRRER